MTTRTCTIIFCGREPVQGKSHCQPHSFIAGLYQTQQVNAQLALAVDTNELLKELLAKLDGLTTELDGLTTELQIQRIRQTA